MSHPVAVGRCGAVVAELIAQGACMSARVLVKQFDWTDAHTDRLQSPQGSGLEEENTSPERKVIREGEASVLILVQDCGLCGVLDLKVIGWLTISVGLFDIANHSEILLYYLRGGKELKSKHSILLSFGCYFRCRRFDIYSFLRSTFQPDAFKAWWVPLIGQEGS